MIRRKGLQRAGEIARTSPGRTNTPLERVSRLRSSGPVKAKRKPMSPAERAARKTVRKRSRGDCEIGLPGCWITATDWSHRWAAGRCGPWAASNGLAACRSCHSAITVTNGRRAEYERLGYICRTDADTTLERVWLRGERWVWLADDETEYRDTPPVPLSDYQPKGA